MIWPSVTGAHVVAAVGGLPQPAAGRAEVALLRPAASRRRSRCDRPPRSGPMLRHLNVFSRKGSSPGGGPACGPCGAVKAPRARQGDERDGDREDVCEWTCGTWRAPPTTACRSVARSGRVRQCEVRRCRVLRATSDAEPQHPAPRTSHLALSLEDVFEERERARVLRIAQRARRPACAPARSWSCARSGSASGTASSLESCARPSTARVLHRVVRVGFDHGHHVVTTRWPPRAGSQ